jgi:hypothetical protein
MTDWLPVVAAAVDGRMCRLRFRDGLGTWESPGPFFLHSDGLWYLVDPPTQVRAHVTHFKPYAEGELIDDEPSETDH